MNKSISIFCENTRVQVPATLHLCRLGYTYLDNITDYDPQTNILKDVFVRSVKRLNPNLTDAEANLQFHEVVRYAKNDDLGREFYQHLSSISGVKLIDFENINNNEWHVATEFECKDMESDDSFRPDITCFVNGLPLAFIEVKKPNSQQGTQSEYERINRRMSNKHFRSFLNLTQLMIFSDNQEYCNDGQKPLQGSFYCCIAREKAFFNRFREEDKNFCTQYPFATPSDDEERKILKRNNCVAIQSTNEYHTNKAVDTPTNSIISSLLCKERFLFLLRYGFAYVERKKELSDGTQGIELQKHVMRYQQLFATLAIEKNLDNGEKGGVIWHTQGSGKTALAYYNVKFLTDYFAQKGINAKFYFIVDRIDLMEQSTDEFASRGLSVRNAQSRDKLMEDLSSRSITTNDEGKLEIMVVNIQKFKDDKSKVEIKDSYNTHIQRIFFIDEAHRGYDPKGCFLANLFEADKDAVRIAMTGTPLLKKDRESWKVFNGYIHTYYYDKSIADGYTCKLIREPIETIYKERLRNIIDELAGNVEVKKKDVDINRVFESEPYLNALIDYVVKDFSQLRTISNDNTVGAMIVCRTNQQARALFELWNKRFFPQEEDSSSVRTGYAQFETPTTMAAEAMPSYDKRDPFRTSLILHDEGDKTERKAYIDNFKKKQGIDILIVNKMLLTGFDAPRLKKLYLGRKLDGHDLLQALTRVNRPYKDFKYGYVVDFVDIKENFEATNNRYLNELRNTEDPDEPQIADTVNSIFINKEEIEEKIGDIRETLFNFTLENCAEFRKEIDAIDDNGTLYHLRTTLNETKDLINLIRAFGDDEVKQWLKKLPIDNVTTLITETTNRINRNNLVHGEDHREDVAGIMNLVIEELSFEFKKGISEELKIVINDLSEEIQRVNAEFDRNFDPKEPRYVILCEEFHKYFKRHRITPENVAQAKADIGYINEVMRKIREINQRNLTLMRHYNNDEKFVRIHKRITEQNETREQPLISKREVEIAESLQSMKEKVDNQIILNRNILDNETAFQQDVLRLISNILLDQLKVEATPNDRKEIRNLITNEYIQQYNGK